MIRLLSFTSRASKRLALLGLLAFASLATGCFKLGPDFLKPETKVSDNWQEPAPGVLKRGDFREWWKLFNDPVLNRLVDMAYRQNLDLRKAAVRIMEARAQLGVAKGSLFPQKQEFGSELGYTKLSEHTPNIVDFSYSGFQAGFDAIWEVDLWGRFRRGIESADANLSASLLDYDDVLISLTAETASSYVQIRTFEQRLKLARENIELQRDSVRITEALLRNGIGSELDVQQAKALLHSTEALLAASEIGLRQSKNALCILLAMPPGQLKDLLGDSQGVPNAPAEIAIGIPADVVRRRPDVRRDELKAAAQCAVIGVAKADLFPRLSLRGSIGIASTNMSGVDVLDVLNTQSLAAKIGPTFSWPILQYGRLKNNVRIQDARFQEALLSYQTTVLRALREVEDAMAGFLRTREQAASLKQSADASRRAVELSLAQYRDGLEDFTRVLNSQLFLVQQQDRLTHAQGEIARNVVAMYKALGGGWELRQGKDILPADIKRDMEQRTDWGELLNDHRPDTLIDD